MSSIRFKKIRERATLEECWCAVKHHLCAEEHLIETAQKLVREAKETSNEERKHELINTAIELLIIQDTVRALRQKLVDILLGLAYEYKRKEST